MKQRWVLNIEDFGKIQNAKIEVSPFMIFVGENNSGKSYLMYLLWGLLSLGRNFFDYKKGTSQAFKKCEEWLTSSIGKNDIIIDKQIEDMFVAWFNELLRQNKKALCNSIFNYEIEIGQIYIDNYRRQGQLKICFDKNSKRISSSSNTIKFPLSDVKYSTAEIEKMLNYICWNLLMDGMTTPLFPVLNRGRASGEPIYLPASRTGFMLTYKELIQNIIGREYTTGLIENAEQYKSDFVLPVAHFLKDWAGLSITENSKYKDVAIYIEKEILKGELKRDKLPVPNVMYRPEQSKKDLPLYVTSSLVTELTPIILFLKSKIAYNLIIIEEPEAHLYPSVQRIIARALVRLVNMGLPVWITTHSDTIFQQINNLIKLNNVNKDIRNKLGYEDIETLNPMYVTAYQFITNNKKTDVEKLELDKRGFSVPTFNKTIYELSKETLELEEEMGEDD